MKVKSINLALTFFCALGISSQGSAQEATPPAAQSFQITGTIRAGKTPLPGVTVTAANTLTGKKLSVVTAANGAYLFNGLPRGRYVVRVEFMGFAPQTQEIVLNPENPSGKLDAELILASRQQEQPAGAASALAASRGFQNLAVDSSLSTTAGDSDTSFGNGQSSVGASDLSSLPLNGAGAEGPTESVSINGTQGRTQDFGSGSEEELRERIQEFRERAQREGGQRGGLGEGPGGGGPPGGGVFAMRAGRNFNINQPHGLLYASDNDAALDARPYSLTGLQFPKASYNLSRFGANVGGPLNIPKIFNGGNKWFFFGGWNGTRGSTPYDAFSTVPTLAERSGDFSASTSKNGAPVQIFDPGSATHQQFQYSGQLNVIDPARISSAARALLAYIPLPNVNTPTQNFHYVTAARNNSDSVNFRLVHNFGSNSGPGGGPFGGGPIALFGRGQRRSHNNINFGLNWTRTSSDIVNPFPSLAGGSAMQGLNASAGWIYGKGRATNMFRVNYNHRHLSTTNLYSTVLDVAGNAGIGGVSRNPFDWGLPGISFKNFGGLTDPTPRRALDQTYSVSDMVSWSHGKHNLRFGGDYRRILQSFRAAKNAEGSFAFNGCATSQFTSGSVCATGYDFADFLLGLPQSASLQSGVNSYDFRANALDLFVQDDWRIRASLTLNFGLRYEYNGPFTEAHNRIANLAVAPGFTAVVPVQPGQLGYPPSLIHPDRNDYAPRIGIAWKPMKQTVIRAGYGINYNLAQYATIVQNFAFQPPFAQTVTNFATTTSSLDLQNAFLNSTVGMITNNFAVDPNYRLPAVQVWDLDLQRTLPHGILLNLGYNGAKGTHLDVQRAPILTIPNVQPFTYDSSAANSILHGGSIRFRKRLAHGIGLGASYVYSKSLDDASSVGGGGAVVAQNALDIAADRGRSSFDQRHKFSGHWIYDLPFGEDHLLGRQGAWPHVLGGWQWNGEFTIASGLPFTPRVLLSNRDIRRGASGSLRANYVSGQPISLDNPSTAAWFNTAAFVNPNGGSFGDAGRNVIQGPRQISVDMSLNKTFQIKETRALEFRVQANNVFNTVHFTSINTFVGSLAYGQVTSAGDMRRLTLLARFRF